MNSTIPYIDFLKSKIKVAENFGFDVSPEALNPILKPHQRDIVTWAIRGGRRAVFASFGLGKTIMQLEVGNHCSERTGMPQLFALPLAVRHEFKKDAKKLGYQVQYCKNTAAVKKAVASGVKLIMTNYERLRDGQIDVSLFGGCCLDEASVIRSMGSQTTQYILTNLRSLQYRFVFTATPSPNEYHELLKYSEFLGIMSISHALSRYFKRDSAKAHNSSLLEHREQDFWLWMSTWATFIVKPSDLGHDDTGYDLPGVKIHWHCVSVKDRELLIEDDQVKMFHNQATSLPETSAEKRISLKDRISKTKKIIGDSTDHWLIWHHREDERHEIQKAFGPACKSVYGSQSESEKETNLIGFAEGKFQFLSTKPEIAGSGCNFQHYCHKAIYVGIDYKFNNFIQAFHRIYRFGQTLPVEIHILYTDAEEDVKKVLEDKWSRHNELVRQMTNIIRNNRLTTNILTDQKRKFMLERKEIKGQNFVAINNDSCIELTEWEVDSVDMIMSSIPFSDLFEYAESYSDMGQSLGDEEFFRHMDYLTPNLLRVLRPGRVACIHVKDVIKYNYQTGAGFPTLHRFSDRVADHFEKHGFYSMGRVTVVTDVVQENKQTNRLGWSEKCKDGTKMGVGLPEYVLIFRKPPTDKSNSYADTPVQHFKEEYTRAKWQLDAHALWKSNGNRLLSPEEIARLDISAIMEWWTSFDTSEPYDHNRHVELCQNLENTGKLPTSFMVLPPKSTNPNVWDDIQRIRTLNTKQKQGKMIKHVCPLQLDLIERLIERYSNKGDVVLDPFGGIMSVPYQALLMSRQAIGIELNTQYWLDGIKHLKTVEYKQNVPTLFDVL